MDFELSNILSGVKVYVWLRSGFRHIMFLVYQRICASFPHKEFALQKDTRVPWYLIIMMSMMTMQSLIWRRTSKIGRRLNLCRGFTLSRTQRKTFQFLNLFSLTMERRGSRHWQVLSVSLMRTTRTSLLHRKSCSDGTLDRNILGSSMCNGWFLQGVWMCK